MLNEDYKDMLLALNDEGVSYLLVGAYALAAHGFPRATMDIDLWVFPSTDNARAVLRALQRFGAPLYDLTQEDLEKEDTIFQIGVAPRRIDLITSASGLKYQDAFTRALPVDVDGIPVRILSVEDLIINKRALGRTKDLADAEALEALRSSQPESEEDAS